MEFMSVGKRTRLQKSLKTHQFRQESSFTKVFRKNDNGATTWVSNSGFSSSNDDDDIDDNDGEDEECLLIDKTEFLRSKFEKNSPQKDVGIEKKISNLGRFHDDHGKNYMGFEDKGIKFMNYNGNHGVRVVNVLSDDNDNNDDDEDDDNKGGRSIDEDDDDDDDEDDCNVEFHMRKFEGIVLPSYCENNNVENNFIGKRTRSHYKTKFPRKKFKDGTLSCPISIDMEEKTVSNHDEEEDYMSPKIQHYEKSCEDHGGKRKRGRPPLKKKEEEEEEEVEFKGLEEEVEFKGVVHRRRTRVKRARSNEVQNVLLNAILENGNEGLEDVMSCVNEAYLSLKFRFGVENLVQENTEGEEELECLFKEMDFALGICEIGLESSCVDEHEDESIDHCDSAILHEKLCRVGKHYWIHDDEIGIKCKFCSSVKLEIRDVSPDFNKDPFGMPEENRYYGQFPYDGINIDSDKFQFSDLSCGSRGEPKTFIDTPGTVWDLIPGTKRTLYPHQRDGFEFIWRNIAGGIKLDEFGKPTKFGLGGCIICHAPGTGKTRLAIVFLQSFMKKYPMSKPVIVAPYSMLRTWEEEFARWNVDTPLFNLNEKELSGKEDPQLVNLYTDQLKDEKTVRMAKLATWKTGKGVLAISYRLFQGLASEGEGIDEKVREVLLKQPGILVLDEGHTPRNGKSKICEVLSGVATKRRVILSGTPFQNNFEELHTTIGLVREEFEGALSCSYNLNENRRIEALKKQIKPFVHVYKGEILRETLGGLFHSLVVLRPSDLQKRFFARLATISSKFIKFDNLISVTSVHPSIFCDQKDKPELLVDEEHEVLLKHKMDLDAGVKTRFLVELIKLCKGERVLVFGQYLPPLNFIGELLKSLFQWSKGRELLCIDGKQDMKDRQSLIKLFNDPKSEARVLLASTKACCEGISLVGASRVVLLDVVWNPSVERQAISRAYRIGQQKDVFVYHLITSGTLEEEKYRRQATKERLADLLFTSSSPSSEAGIMHEKRIGSRVVVSEDHVLQAMIHHDKTKNMFEKIVCQPKADDLITSFGPMSL